MPQIASISSIDPRIIKEKYNLNWSELAYLSGYSVQHLLKASNPCNSVASDTCDKLTTLLFLLDYYWEKEGVRKIFL